MTPALIRPVPRPDTGAALTVVSLATPEGVLELEARRRIYEHLQEYPGLHLRELARAVDMETNHAKYHLTYMERHGLVSSRREDGYWRFWPRQAGSLGPRDRFDRRDKTVLSFLRRPLPLHVVLLLLDEEEATPSHLLGALDVSPSTLHYHLQRMEKAGVVTSHKEGRERFYRLTDEEHTAGLLMRYRPPDSVVAGFLEAWEQLELD
jgi:predicted transcriptional regulator